MNYEGKIIDLINSEMPKSPLRKSVSGEVDSEVILLGDKEYLFTTDDFSQEDLLQENDPFVLGWNVACGAISDIIAAGGKPLIYSHSMVIPDYWDEQYIKRFSSGISKVLQKYSSSFIGGDLGLGDNWRYTTSVIGVHVGRPLNRRGCQTGDSIFITGKIGAGNLIAALNLHSSNKSVEKLLNGTQCRFNTHEKLPGIISEFASSAIDTSDGVFAALQSIANLNGTGFNINDLPFVAKGVLASETLHLPILLLFFGECGEYEILFTVNKQNKGSLKAALTKNKIEAYELGEITGDAKQKTLGYHNSCYNLDEYKLRARDFKRLEDYLREMTEWIEIRGKRN